MVDVVVAVVDVDVVLVVLVVLVVEVVVVVTSVEVLAPVKLPLTPYALFVQVPERTPEVESIAPVKLEPVVVEPTVICNEPLVDT